MGFPLFEGELYELRAQLAAREGHEAEKIAALQRAHECYTRFGMTAQAARVAASMPKRQKAKDKSQKYRGRKA